MSINTFYRISYCTLLQLANVHYYNPKVLEKNKNINVIKKKISDP